MRHCLRLVVACLVGLSITVAAQIPATTDGQETFAARIIEEPLRIVLPVEDCTVPGMAAAIALSVAAPFGAEYVPGCAPPQRRPLQEVVTLTGMSAGQALDALVNLDPRYLWLETDGVLVIRPAAAWQDRDHFLHRSLPSFAFRDFTLVGALRMFGRAVAQSPDEPDWPAGFDEGRTPQAARRFSVSLGATSLYEAFNAVVRAHGALQWRVEYCRPAARPEYATIWVRTFDGAGAGDRRVFPRDAAGRRYDPCRVGPDR